MKYSRENNLNLPFVLKEEHPFVDRFLMTLAYMRLVEVAFGGAVVVSGILVTAGLVSGVVPAAFLVLMLALHGVEKQVSARGTNVILNNMPDAYQMTVVGQSVLAEQFGMTEEEFKKNIRQKQLRGDDLDLSTPQ